MQVPEVELLVEDQEHLQGRESDRGQWVSVRDQRCLGLAQSGIITGQQLEIIRWRNCGGQGTKARGSIQ